MTFPKTLRAAIITMCLVMTSSSNILAKKVYSPKSHPGSKDLELQSDFVRDDNPLKNGYMRQQLEIAAGITDWWQTGVYFAMDRANNAANFSYAATKWENVFVPRSWDQNPFRWGVYLEYVQTAGSRHAPNAIEGKLLLENRGARWTHTLNIGLDRELSRDTEGTAFGYAWRSRVPWREFELAIEAYGSLGTLDSFLPFSEQSHLIGPVVSTELGEHLEIEAGWLMNVHASPASGDFKINLEVPF